MDDKDRMGEIGGATDALRPERPGGEPKAAGETDPQPDPALAIPRSADPGADAASEAPREADDRAAGTIDNPIAAGDGFGSDDHQADDRSELSAQRGGPVDVSRDRPKRR